MNNYEKYFGTPAKAAESISRLVDRYDAHIHGEEYHSDFTDNFEHGGDCAYGLLHQDTLHNWLEREEHGREETR